MKNKVQKKLYQYTVYFEMFIGFIIVIAIIITMFSLMIGLREMFLNPLEENALNKFLGIAFNIIIGLEFLKMLCNSNLSTVVEVLLFALARQLIVEHTTVFENLIGVLSIAILFLIRKYLFIPQLDEE